VTWNWFDLAWPWIGLLVALMLLALMFTSSLFRGDPAVSRWRDRVWLSWLPIPVYMIHQCEEYGIDLRGVRHSFPGSLCNNLGLGSYPACPIPPLFYLAVNTPLIWIVAPICALMSRRHPLVGLSFYGLFLANGLVHFVPLFTGSGYGAGLLTAATLFLPLFAWMTRALFVSRQMKWSGLAIVVATGFIMHAILIVTLLAFVRGSLSASVLAVLQVVNSTLFVFLPLMGEMLTGVKIAARTGSA
jgi:uncharacterized protein with HXXEE motif